jgi:hypothetical protein
MVSLYCLHLLSIESAETLVMMLRTISPTQANAIRELVVDVYGIDFESTFEMLVGAFVKLREGGNLQRVAIDNVSVHKGAHAWWSDKKAAHFAEAVSAKPKESGGRPLTVESKPGFDRRNLNKAGIWPWEED